MGSRGSKLNIEAMTLYSKADRVQTAVGVPILATHRSAANFKRPDSFIPERFMGASEFESDNRNAVQAFSVGPRNCLGRKYV